ncbi:MAG: hypothetical protein M5U34_08345 [Chloroflexi bacterium]|nr:hypothetical protein [Chloroflexota bacterium]
MRRSTPKSTPAGKWWACSSAFPTGRETATTCRPVSPCRPTIPHNTWAMFVDETVGRYAGRINHWIIWNEPDITDPETPGHTWDGDLDDFIQLLRVAYLTAKAANPDAVIHLPALTYYWDPTYLDRFF